jgi:methionine sulfoxide reductase heme-binding subunit
MSHHRPPASNAIPGGLAYALMFAMAATSNDRSMRAMGRWWKRLHRVGIHYLWFIFAFTFFSHARSNDTVWGPTFLIVGLAGLALRIAVSRGGWVAEHPTTAEEAESSGSMA